MYRNPIPLVRLDLLEEEHGTVSVADCTCGTSLGSIMQLSFNFR